MKKVSDDEEPSERLQLRVSKAFLKQLDDWRRGQPDLPSRTESIRRLVALGVAATTSAKRPARCDRTIDREEVIASKKT